MSWIENGERGDSVRGKLNELKDEVEGCEPDLGVPAKDGQVLSSSKAGARSWIDQQGGGSDPDCRVALATAKGTTNYDDPTPISLYATKTAIDLLVAAMPKKIEGPASALIDNIMAFADTAGKTAKDTGTSVAALLSAIAAKLTGTGTSTVGHFAAYQNDTGKSVTDSGKGPSDFDPMGAATGAITAHNTAYAHANIPTADQKAALAGANGQVPSDTNRVVCNGDPRLAGGGGSPSWNDIGSGVKALYDASKGTCTAVLKYLAPDNITPTFEVTVPAAVTVIGMCLDLDEVKGKDATAIAFDWCKGRTDTFIIPPTCALFVVDVAGKNTAKTSQVTWAVDAVDRTKMSVKYPSMAGAHHRITLVNMGSFDV